MFGMMSSFDTLGHNKNYTDDYSDDYADDYSDEE
jgi:hypothetical protein